MTSGSGCKPPAQARFQGCDKLDRCKRRCFCCSCHQKRALLFAEPVDRDVLGDLPVRQYVVTIPKMLRLCFQSDRKLL